MKTPLPRAALILAVLVVMWVLPLLGQVFGVGGLSSFSWQMFAHKGLARCHTVFVERTEEGDVELDRFALLNETRRAAHELRNLRFPAHVDRAAERLCHALTRDGRARPDVRVIRRCATRLNAGWRMDEDAERNRCVPRARR